MARPARRSAVNNELGARARELRAKGYTYALIERELHIPYLQARELAAQYDAEHGRPKRIVRTAPSSGSSAGTITIPVRDLRNYAARILRQVEKGQRFLITVSGRPVAELSPALKRSVFVPRAAIESIIREAPLDPQFAADLDEALDETIDEL